MFFLGLDIGTTMCKAFIYSEDGREISSGRGTYTLYHDTPELSELDPREVWETIVNAVNESIARGGLDPSEIGALSFSTLGHAVMAVDERGDWLSRCMQFYDVRGQTEAANIEAKLGREHVAEIIGWPYFVMSPISKILWLRENRPEVYRKTAKFISWQEYVAWRLCGRFVTDYSLASCVGLFDLNRKCWSNELLEATDVDEELMPEVVCSGTLIGEAEADAAKELGLKKIPVVAGAHDIYASALGCGIVHPGDTMDLTGTVEIVTSAIGREKRGDAILCQGINRTEDIPVVLHAMSTAGVIFRWLRDNFGYEELQKAEKEGLDAFDLLTERASNAKPGSDKLFFLPDFSGSLTNRDSRGVLLGLTLGHGKDEVIRAVLEGLSFEFKSMLEFIEGRGAQVEEIRAIGGGAKSDLWLQMKADIADKKILRPEITEGGSLGAAVLGGIGVGVYRDAFDAVEQVIRITDRFESDKERVKLYNKYYSKIFCRMRTDLSDLFEEMSSL
jgi:sugar (pentulose or hexulose) kinase